MAEDLIDNYVDRNGVRGDTDFIVAALREVYNEFKKLESVKIDMKGVSGLAGLAPIMQQAKAGADSLATATNTVSQRIAQMNGNSKEFTQVLLAQTKAQKEAAQTALLQAKAANESAKAKQAETKATEQSAKAKEREAKLLDQAIDDYLQLSKAYNEASLKAKNYVLRLGEGHPIAIQAVKDANDLGNTLKRLDASVGQNQRNVGNYASAYNGLGMSFAQVSRELPSLSISFQQFALAISNNLPMVADELKKTKLEIAALKAEGKDAPSLFSKIGSSLFSWQVGLSVGITLFVLYSKQIVSFFESLVTGSNAFDEAREKLRLYNKALEDTEYKNAITEVKELSINIKLAKEGFIDKEVVLKQYNETIGKTTQEAKSLDEAEALLVKNADAYIKVTLLKAAANAALAEAAQIAVDLAKEQSKRNPNLSRTEDEAEFGKLIRQSEEYLRLNKEIDNFKIGTPGFVAAQQQLRRFYDDQLEFLRGGAKAKSEKTLEDIASDFLKQAAILEQQFSFRTTTETDTDTGSGKDDVQKRLKDQADKKLQLLFEIQAIEIQQRIDFNKEVADNENASLLDRFRALEQFYNASTELIFLDAETQKQIGTKTAEEILLIQTTANDRLLRLELDLQKNRERILNQFSEKFTATEKGFQVGLQKIAEDGYKRFLKSEEERTKKLKDESAKRRKIEEDEANERRRLQQQLATEIQNLAFTLLSSNVEKEKNELQDQIDLLEQKKQKDIEVANQTIANAQDRAAAISVIEARANAEREQLQKRQRDLDIRKAQFDKAQAIARIIQETAQNVIKYFGTPLALLAGAIGAIQLATVIAQPIPRYKHGKNVNDLYEGPAVVGDGGKKEAIIRENGQVEITSDRPQLTYVKSRDIVIPDATKLANYVIAGHMGGKLVSTQSVPTENNLEREVKAMRKDIVHAIKNKPELKLSSNEAGLSAMWKYGANQIRYIQDQTNW